MNLNVGQKLREAFARNGKQAVRTTIYGIAAFSVIGGLYAFFVPKPGDNWTIVAYVDHLQEGKDHSLRRVPAGVSVHVRACRNTTLTAADRNRFQMVALSPAPADAKGRPGEPIVTPLTAYERSIGNCFDAAVLTPGYTTLPFDLLAPDVSEKQIRSAQSKRQQDSRRTRSGQNIEVQLRFNNRPIVGYNLENDGTTPVTLSGLPKISQSLGGDYTLTVKWPWTSQTGIRDGLTMTLVTLNAQGRDDGAGLSRALPRVGNTFMGPRPVPCGHLFGVLYVWRPATSDGSVIDLLNSQPIQLPDPGCR